MPKQLLASKPPMGWNSWNLFGSQISESAVREMADVLVASGLKDCGYEYLVVDDCWAVKDSRDTHGNLTPDPERFPNGMKPVADYVHSQGLKFGIYSDAAEMTCAGYPGSYGFEAQDAALWASWGVDYLKYDYCHAPTDQASAIERYTRMGQALKNCGRDILFSICEWGVREPWQWARQTGGQMWRATGDVMDNWTTMLQAPWWKPETEGLPGLTEAIAAQAGPGGWNDMDMLVVGLNGTGHIPGQGASFWEYRMQMSMWSVLCSPLMIGCDIRAMSEETRTLLMNREILAINQDRLGRQAVRVRKEGPLEVWRKPLADGSMVLALLNLGSESGHFAFGLAEAGWMEAEKAQVRDVWKGEDVADLKAVNKFSVLPHDTLVLKVSG
jgi:alpha-galactosidase